MICFTGRLAARDDGGYRRLIGRGGDMGGRGRGGGGPPVIHLGGAPPRGFDKAAEASVLVVKSEHLISGQTHMREVTGRMVEQATNGLRPFL